MIEQTSSHLKNPKSQTLNHSMFCEASPRDLDGVCTHNMLFVGFAPQLCSSWIIFIIYYLLKKLKKAISNYPYITLIMKNVFIVWVVLKQIVII